MALIAVVLIAAVVLLAWQARPSSPLEVSGDAALVDAGYLERVEDHPLAVALLVIAGEDRVSDLEAMRTDMGLPRPEPFDAFQDGSLNPAGTRYLMGAVWEIHAMLDAGAADDLTARVALNWARCCWTEDHWWYSEMATDAAFVTNVNAQMAGAVQRLVVERPDLFTDTERAQLADRADAAIRRVIATAGAGPQWTYHEGSDRLNDLGHYGYVAWGLAMYREHGGAVPIPWSNDQLARVMTAIEDVAYHRAAGPGMRLAFACRFAPAYIEQARATLYDGPYTFYRDQAHEQFGRAMCAAYH